MAKRGFQTTEQAQAGRARGHQKAKEFAHAIGLLSDYKNDHTAKKDVIDPSGDAHSLKSGKKKWQIFLYSFRRVSNDTGFTKLNGMGDYLGNLLKAFPENYAEYIADKYTTKLRLQDAQRELATKLQDREMLKAFFSKSLFNGNEVNYLTVYGEKEEKYHVFLNQDIVDKLSSSLVVSNSRARNSTQMDALKTVFLLNDKNFAEIEVRTEQNHYREIRFNMYVTALELFLRIDPNPSVQFESKVLVYGKAKKKFPRW